MKGKIAVKTYLREIEGLGEFKFIFTVNTNHPDQSEYYVESFFNPFNYGSVDFLVGYYVNNIDEEIKRYENDFDYFIDSARISCEYAIQDTDDIDGEYTGILMNYFDYTEEDIDNLISEER